jgi:hypothetical protein
MATGSIAHVAASGGADGTAAAARLGRDRSTIIRSHLEQLGLEGKIFIAGVGLEGTALTGQTSLAETTPAIWLASPPGGNILVRPLWFEALVSAEGGAAPDWYLSVVTASIGIATAGTTVTPQSIGKVGATSAATLQTAPTTAAWTNAQNVRLRSSENALDNIISVEGATTVNLANDMMNRQTTIHYEFPFPLYLADGQAFAFHSATGTTGQDFEWLLVFAELDAEAHR